MPEFDEQTHQKKSRKNQSLKYEPGRNADRYKSKKPGTQKKNQNESAKSSLWVEATMNTSHIDTKSSKSKNKKNTPIKRNPNNKGRSGNRNYRRGRRKPPTLWEKILGFFGIKPKKRKFHKGKKGNFKQSPKKPNNQNKNQKKGAPQGQRQGNDNRRKPKGEAGSKPRQQRQRTEGENQPRKRKPRNESDSAKGGNNRNTENRKPRQPKKDNPRPRSESNKSQNETPVKVESIAAPKTDTSSITLGAIEVGPKVEKKESKPVAAVKGKRNRRNAGGASKSGAAAGSEFVPHPIDVKSKGENKKDNSEA